MVNIYILQLEDNKYYIGKTTQPEIRLESHFNSNGSSWTKKYKPIKVIEIMSDCDDFDEDKYTLKYMQKNMELIMLEVEHSVKLNWIKII